MKFAYSLGGYLTVGLIVALINEFLLNGKFGGWMPGFIGQLPAPGSTAIVITGAEAMVLWPYVIYTWAFGKPGTPGYVG